jgi:hypothetical protein
MTHDFDKTRPLIAQLHGWRPGFFMVLPPSIYDHYAAAGYDMTDIKRSKPMPKAPRS